MARKAKKRDVNEEAATAIAGVTGLGPPTGVYAGLLARRAAKQKADGTKNQAAVALGRLGGLKGGKARAAALTKEERSAIAKKAAAARWKEKKAAPVSFNRDAEILRLVQNGKTSKEIGKQLGVSTPTISKYLERMKAALGLVPKQPVSH